MDPQLQALYTRVKAREIGLEEAAKQFAEWKLQRQQGDEELFGTLLAALRQAASRVLGVDAQDLDGDVRLHEYGFDHVKMAAWFTELGERYGLALNPELLREYPTLHGVAQYLLETFGAVLQEHLRTGAGFAVAASATSDLMPSVASDDSVSDQLRDRAVDYFKRLLSSFLKIPLQSLEAEVALEQYGINSVLIVDLTGELEKRFGSLPKTLFFEYQNLGELTDYFLASHKDRLQALLGGGPQATSPKVSGGALPGEWRQQQGVTAPAARMARYQTTTDDAQRRPLQQPNTAPLASLPPQSRHDLFDVAIIGLSGRYPAADNLAQFWENLRAGRHAISEIPGDRWDWRAYFDTEKGKLGSIYTKWGGFLSEVDTFDPLFFRISPAEAQSMDPQERLFIEEVYAAIEDAGYTPATLGERDATTGRADRRIGVFVGVMNSTYGGNARYWSIANRVSYLFDLQGPSLAVDTACSSSLTAIHLALESLYRGDCTCAIAGGVNVIVDPIHFQGLAAMTMLSPTEQCKAFGAGADGFVAGEGVGVILLKPLARAIEDRDHIYGVIKGSAVNAGGKTNGYTVPNPRAQARVIAEAIRRAGVDPRTVSYVEAHGTGTALGDPIEIAGLSQAFAQMAGAGHSSATQFCRIGSVKSNIGHLESAAGIAGLTKVLLQLQHRQLVPSLHATVLNPGIDFAHSPFTVQQELAEWPRPFIEVDGEVREYPRIAGISSFGAGGANAHLVIAEYEGDGAVDAAPWWPSDRAGADGDMLQPALIVLSAKSAAQLQERARRLLAALRKNGRAWSERDLADLAYTLQVGREAMEERLALVVYSAVELEGKLALFLEEGDDAPGLLRGRAGGTSPAGLPPDLAVFASDEDVRLALDAWVAKGKYDKLLSLWTRGLTIDWDGLLYARTAGDQPVREKPRRLSLPTYPFAKERYWARRATQANGPAAAGADGMPDSVKAIADQLPSPTTGHDLRAHLPLPRGEGTVSQQEEVSAPAGITGADLLREKTAAYLAQLIAPVLGLPAHRLATDVSLGQYGMDSVMAMQLTVQLEKTFGPLSKTLLFEYQDLRALSDFFMTSYRDRLRDVLGVALEAAPDVGVTLAAAIPPAPIVDWESPDFASRPPQEEEVAAVDADGTVRHPRFMPPLPPTVESAADIAIIGLAGRYPQAKTLDEFWENLRTGQDCITEIPPERWDHSRYFEASSKNPGKAYSKWGGFLEEVDRFDPLFFNIAPRDAELMDPQERLFLECIWHLLENAGYTREILRVRERSRVGVYVGAMSQQYHAFDADLIRESAVALSSYYSIANRVSYFFDFQGPSLAVDTACSSALVAVHMACDSLLKGECRLAIAGGVNLSIHPKKYLALSMAQIVGSHADSCSFGDGDGYLPAEGVGAVLLKPLAQAVRDGDAILAVIKSSAINHSGHTHGYSVPSPSAQAQLIVDNFRKAGIDPRTVSYVESAANGSALGDPIEVKALTMAFREFTADQGFCAIGSVKSNIGHAEAASGMSQLTKVVLQLQHGLLVPTIKAEPLNPNLSFEGSPFYLQRQLSEWRRPVIDGVGECPRCAAISSIGAGGTNAHLIVEEYVKAGVGTRSADQGSGDLVSGVLGDFAEESAIPSADQGLGGSRQAAGATHAVVVTGPVAVAGAPQIVVLSARSGERLRAVAEQMLAFVRRHPDCSLADLAYTLQVGREAMASRLALVVASCDELVQGLDEFLQVAAVTAQIKPGVLATSVPMFVGDLEGDGAEIRSLLAGRAGEAVAQVFLAEGNLAKLALHWTQGGDVPWQVLHAGKSVCKIPLPNYPFARERYWIAAEKVSGNGNVPSVASHANSPLPPGESWGEGGRSSELTWGPPHSDPVPGEEGGEASVQDQIAAVLTAVLSEELSIPTDAIRPHRNFQDYGADSIAVLKMARGIEEVFGAKVSGREMLEYPTVASLSRHLAEKLAAKMTATASEETEPDAIVAETSAPLDGAVQTGLNLWDTSADDLHGSRPMVEAIPNPCDSTPSAGERTRAATGWDWPMDVSGDEALLHHAFTAQARRMPNRTAVVLNEACLSYRELDVRSTRLAGYLQRQGVEPDTVVGLCLARSLDMIVGVLGILKAGAAYVPLDPDLAEGRMAHIVRDSGMSMLLAHASTLPRIAALQHDLPTLRVIDLERALPAVEQSGAQVLPPRVNGAHLAYMIYTSGSTGQPKGVMIPHSAAARQCEVVRERWGIDVEARVLQFTPLSFDASVEQIFATLSAGATLVLSDSTSLAPKPFSDMLAAQQIDILNVPPAFALELLREWQRRPELIPGGLRLLVTGGDVLAIEAVRLWQTLLQGCVALLNAYGPTETTITACLHSPSPVSEADTKVPIGRPLGDRQVYILDRDGRHTPPGVAGEICIGGMGLARGYQCRPALTAAAFLPHPFADTPGARLYRSGDRGRFLPDGGIEFLGRLDHQVKIRGYRIELGEIEAALAGHPEVAQAVVTTLDGQDDRRLVGYVVPKTGQTLDPQELQRSLRQKLPAYMIPSRFVVLQRLPLTASGKIDRLALPAPTKFDGQASAPPRDEVEWQLAEIWEMLLDVGRPGIHDDFFASGGHSILAIRLLALLRDKFGVELPLPALLQAPTIADLAEMLRGAAKPQDFTHLVALQKGPGRPFFCVPGVGGTVFYLLKLASLLGRDQPFYGLQSQGLDGITAPYTNVEAIADHYIQAIQRLQPQGPYLLGGHSFGGHVAFEMAVQLEAMGQEVGALVLVDCPAPATLNLQQTWDESALLLAFASILGIQLRDNPALVRVLLEAAEREEKLAAIYDEVTKLDDFPLRVEMGQFKGLFQVYLTNSLIQYNPRGRLEHTPITLLAAERPHSEALLSQEDFARITDQAALRQRLAEMSAAWAEYDRELQRLWGEDPFLGWGRFSARPVQVRRVPGSHMDMIYEPHVHVLAALLRETIGGSRPGEDVSDGEEQGPPATAGTNTTSPVSPPEKAPAASPHVQPAETYYPLSKVQEGLWLLQKFSPQMSAYNVPVAIRFKQGFDAGIFRDTCAFLLEQYPILGSRFVEVDGEPQQYIPAHRPLSFTQETIDHLGERDLMPFLSAKVKEPFDLERGPLMRVQLFTRGQGPEVEHIGLITIHHIVFDGTSSILLASALVSAYHALSRGEALKCITPEASYQDFVDWEQAMLSGPEGREHLGWWRQHLAGELPVLALRTDHPRPGVRSFNGATLEATLDPSLSEQLRALSRSQRVSLSTLLLGLYKVLLHRYTGQEDLIIGMPTMGRPKHVFDQVMGCFINMMAVRSRVSGEQSFVDYLKTLQLTLIDGLDHAVYPFSELVRELKVERDQSISPIFQTYYTYQNYVSPGSADVQRAESQGALQAEFLTGIHQEGDKDLGLEVYEEADRFTLNIKYNPDLYKAATIQRLLGHLTQLAAAVVQQPYESIASYDIFSAEQKAEMLCDWNDTTRPFPQAQLLFELFTEQAAETPDCTAVVFKDQHLTYAGLERRSRTLAAYLQRQGVRPETFVGLYVERSMEIVVGAVGILRAGGVYVPLDPSLPEERLAYMLEDARVAFLLTTKALAARAQTFKNRIPTLEVIALDQDWPAIERCAALYTPPALHPGNLAYVIYTSGSTGRPKGVMISHLTTTRHCHSIRDDFRISSGERVCLQSPIAFDASVEQIFAPLSIGATVAIRDLEVLSPKPFSAMLADLKVNVIQLPPAFILALFREWQLNPHLIPADLKLLVSCGDVLAVETVRLWQAMLKDRVTLLNVYGPTEVTAKATFHQVAPDLNTRDLTRIPIGRPLANKKIYILDRYAHPTPVGVPGELHIGGTGPGRGYHSRPGLTAEKFIPDPYSAEPGARMYNAGDLAYYRHDGVVEFLGRTDHQVKVRGHRIELGEIEAVLAGHPEVKSAAVITVDMREDKRLVAYVVAKDGQSLAQGDLKSFVGRHLPDYMVPSAFVCLEQMPLTPSGKINRRGLPLPEGVAREDAVAPRDAVELELTRIWEEVLERGNIDIRQDFFALGGHSLLAIRLMVLIEERLGRELPLATLFQAPTIEQLADILRAQDAEAEPTLVCLQALGSKRPFFCVPGAGGTVLYLNELARHLGQHQPMYAFQARGLDGRCKPYDSVPRIAEHYIQAMRAVQPEGPYVLGGHSFGGRVAFEMARILEQMGQPVQQLVLLDCSAPQPDDPGHDWDETALLIAFAAALGLDIGGDLDLLAGVVADRELDHQLERLLQALKRHDLVLPDTRMARLRGLFQVFNANNRLTYVPGGPIKAGITLFKAADFQPRVIDDEYFRQAIADPDIRARIEAMNCTWARFNAQAAKTREDPHLGWDRYTTAAVTAHDVPGDHMTLVREPHVQVLASVMRASILAQ